MSHTPTARQPSTRKRMFWMLLAVLVIFGGGYLYLFIVPY